MQNKSEAAKQDVATLRSSPKLRCGARNSKDELKYLLANDEEDDNSSDEVVEGGGVGLW